MMRIFRLAEFVRDEHLTLIVERSRMFGALAVTYQVAPAPSDDGARLVAKLVTRLGRASLMRAILPLGAPRRRGSPPRTRTASARGSCARRS